MHFGVTGSNGYIGKNLVNLLYINNYKFKTLTKSHINFENDNNFQFKNFDDLPTNFFKNLDVIIHLAGIAHNSKSKSDSYKVINVEYTKYLAEQSIKNKIKKFIFISSIKAIDQEHLYGKSKFEAEIELKKVFQNIKKTRLIIIRPGLVYGGNVKGNLKLIKNYLNFRISPILKYSHNKMSMIHVEDLVNLFIFLSLINLDSPKVIEAHDGKKYSTEDVFISIYKKIHKKNYLTSVDIKFLSKLPFLKIFFKKLYNDSFFKSNHLEEIGFKCKKYLI